MIRLVDAGRLDPFVLPTATTGRFVLLLATAAGTTFFAYDFLFLTVGPSQAQPCPDPAAPCTAPFGAGAAAWMVGGVVLLFTVATAIYWAMPAWTIRRDQLSPWTPDDAPDLDGTLAELVRQAGLDRAPTFLSGSDNRTTGQAFGRLGNYRVSLGAGLLKERRVRPELFRTVVRHELAHLSNRDVDISCFTKATWYALLVVVLLPLGVAMVAQPGLWLIGVGWRAALLTLVIRLMRDSILRTREYYADARAAEPPHGTQWHATGESRRWWILTEHPPDRRRGESLADPALLFHPKFAEAVGTGLVSTLALSDTVTLLLILHGRWEPVPVRWLAALIFVPAAGCVLALSVWRADLVGRATPTRLLVTALGLAAGMLAGYPLSLPASVTGIWGAQDTPTLATAAVLVAFLPAAALLVVGWTAVCVRAWQPDRPVGPPRLGLWVSVLTCALLLTVVVGYWQYLHDQYPMFGPLAQDARAHHAALGRGILPIGPYWLWVLFGHSLAVGLVESTVIWSCLIAAWLIPLAAVVRRSPSAVRRAVVVGVLGGVGYAVLLLLWRMALHRNTSPADRESQVFLQTFDYWQLALAVGVQSVVALLVAGSARQAAVLLGMAAAFVTGLLAAATQLGAMVLAGCRPMFGLRPGSCGWDITGGQVLTAARWNLVEGGFAAIAAGLLGLSLSTLVRRAVGGRGRRDDPARDDEIRPGHRPGRRQGALDEKTRRDHPAGPATRGM